MIEGTIIKGIGGFYYVRVENKIYECRARGRFRKEKITPLVGDHVHISVDNASKQGVIEGIMDRKTELIRPPVANVDQAVIVFAIQQPDPKLSLLDRFLILAENEDLDVVICLNKIDLEAKEELQRLRMIYEQIGYQVIATSTKVKMGVEDLKECLKNQTTVFAGPSGVGKSSLLNSIQPNLALQTGEISQKIERGKHTTRHVELLPLEFGGWVLDTPGFSSLQVDFIDKEELQYLFKEFNEYLDRCKFQPCNHINEPDCAVKRALEHGHIHISRYESYRQLLEEIEQARRY
ncbi:ribosome small subunit-dependent GTPase A [Geosporobacter ferrireducens]|uniref:Small ribosomal subunit biogenesis GTPase RsgA n=1 Tax=Geosporobacter ferrireducens TaxID=1424294 RepID=A0A1D8GBX9_9FIRM|nr:ribosome small subunit-dependent GTPase A [Geosporobacter ferrireducens]AOT68412.1 ribosome small subunit-dependent GTPase A [Geosporobacter ferrireducens]MTI53865.1 ribosome small subunit-dependent GTPase A [Geosporobacter ferrireducens]